MPSLLNLSCHEAKSYFLEPENYVNFDLPPYFSFDNILRETSKLIGAHRIHEFFDSLDTEDGRHIVLNPKAVEGVNYRLIGNKDGEFGWRPFEIIHPALYVALVNEITAPECWAELMALFTTFQQSAVRCESIPFKSEDDEKHKAHQIKLWWTNVEQAGLQLSLRYRYVHDADITDCYGSIYTHSIAWAIHTKAVAKEKREKVECLGNRIDWLIQKMRNGQTNGIPQGSTLMDFIAEILLGYVDVLLTQRLDTCGLGREEYTIIRYRDDYKIYTNNPEDGRLIVKELSSVLSDLGLKLNTSKTRANSDPVLATIKPDKLYELIVPNNRISMSKRLMQIYGCSDLYPNSGLVIRKMSDYYYDLNRVNTLKAHDNPLVMIAIVTNLAIKNPKAYPWCMAVLSKLLTFCDPVEWQQIISDIRKKFEIIPNTGLLDLWLQRISYKVDPTLHFNERLAQIASGDYQTNIIWKSSWLKKELRDVIMNTPIVKREVIEEMHIVIPPEEVALFKPPQLS